MERIGIFFRLKPGAGEEYKKRHDDIWPEMTQALDQAGIHNYSIWRHREMLFAYFEASDFAKAQKILAGNPVYSRWREWMEEVVYIDEDTGQKEWPMDRVFFHA